MTDLAAWLLEQIAEDERVAGDLPADGHPEHDGRVLSVRGTMDVPWPDRWNPVRVLAECNAKRRIVGRHQNADPGIDYCGTCHDYAKHDAAGWPCATLRLLALPYADRQGYREEWRP